MTHQERRNDVLVRRGTERLQRVMGVESQVKLFEDVRVLKKLMVTRKV